MANKPILIWGAGASEAYSELIGHALARTW